jgi:hypothetical protein
MECTGIHRLTAGLSQSPPNALLEANGTPAQIIYNGG